MCVVLDDGAGRGGAGGGGGGGETVVPYAHLQLRNKQLALSTKILLENKLFVSTSQKRHVLFEILKHYYMISQISPSYHTWMLIAYRLLRTVV